MTQRLAVLTLAWLALTGASAVMIQFAARQQPPPPDIPAEGRRAGPADARDHGPLGGLMTPRLARIEITWWDPTIFAKESALRGYLARLLATPRAWRPTSSKRTAVAAGWWFAYWMDDPALRVPADAP